MAKTATSSAVLHQGDRVRAIADLRGVPEGTTGTVAMVDGLTWFRYWVRFDNGVSLGSINRKHLATIAEWERKLAGVDEDEASGDEGGDEGESAAVDGGGGGGVTTSNGTVVPQRIIDRSIAARARLTGG